jgi:hypothetical protein
VGSVVDKVALGRVFSEYFGFPCHFLFPRLLHIHHHLSSGAGTIDQLVAYVPSGLSITPPQETKKKTNVFKVYVYDRGSCILDASCDIIEQLDRYRRANLVSDVLDMKLL